MEAFILAEKKLKPNPLAMFTDVYKEVPTHIKEQMEEMISHLDHYKDHYPIKAFSEINRNVES